jgi:RimJ/RimL family protein N-acetyltransferase
MSPSLPLGPAVDPTPSRLPGPVTLQGRTGTVEKLDAARHGPSLWEAVRGHDAVWTYMSYGPYADSGAFASWLAEREQLKDPFYFAIVDKHGRAVGVFTLLEIRPTTRVAEVGHVVYTPALQRTPLATEAQYLLAKYAFETLGVRRYEWKCNVLNEASYHAALRLGFSYEGLFRQHMIVKGRSRDTAWFAMLDSQWPTRKAAFERWLSPDNFDVNGLQRTKLAAGRD